MNMKSLKATDVMLTPLLLGTEFIDRVDLGNGLIIEKQGLGVANHSDDFEGVDGILGYGSVMMRAQSMLTSSN